MSQDQFSENLKIIVAEKLKGLQNFNEDVKYVAEYIVLLIINGGTVESIVPELTTLFDAVPIESLTSVVQTAFFALEALQQGEPAENIVAKIQEMNNAESQGQQQQQQQQQQQPAPQQQQPVPQQQPQQLPGIASNHASSVPQQQQEQPQPQPQQQQQQNEPAPLVSAFSGIVATPAKTDDTIVAVQPRFSQRGGAVGKRGRGGRGGARGGSRASTRGNYGNSGDRFNPLAKALGMGGSGASNVNYVSKKKEGRCKLFPHCPLGKSCPHAHPTRVCNDYPNCPKPVGTCEYLHPDEDQELMKDIEKTREEFQKRKEAFLAARTRPVQTGIVICKFGVMCSNPMCPFGHPTPANEDAKVIDLMWCENNLTCQDPTCKKAHSSLSKLRPVSGMGRPQNAGMGHPQSAGNPADSRPPVEKSLEQCKYGTHCTNKRCKFRHARSPVMCRDGANCTRIDCIFGHPINEDCRFGINCTNAACLFRHPEGRIQPVKKGQQQQQQQPDQQQQQQQPMFGEQQQQQQNAGGLQSMWGAQPAQQNVPMNQRSFALPEGSHIEAAPKQENFAPAPAFAPQDNDAQME